MGSESLPSTNIFSWMDKKGLFSASSNVKYFFNNFLRQGLKISFWILQQFLQTLLREKLVVNLCLQLLASFFGRKILFQDKPEFLFLHLKVQIEEIEPFDLFRLNKKKSICEIEIRQFRLLQSLMFSL